MIERSGSRTANFLALIAILGKLGTEKGTLSFYEINRGPLLFPESAKLWRYYWDTIEACVPPSGVIDTLTDAGFSGAKRHIETPALSIFAEYQAVKPG